MLRKIADGVFVHQSECIETNGVVVQGSTGVLLIDPGLTNDELRCLDGDLRELGLPVVAGFATHPDWDHVLWHASLGDVPRYGTADCAAFMREVLAQPNWLDQVADGLPPEIADDVPMNLFGQLTGLPDGATRIPWEGPEVRIIEHRAHAEGHAALFIPDRGVLVAGDMLSDVLVPMLDVHGAIDPVEDYLHALQLFEDLSESVSSFVPGHGSKGGAAEFGARIALDRAYVHALRDGSDFDDPRFGPAVRPGWEWVEGVHLWQVRSFEEKNGGADE